MLDVNAVYLGYIPTAASLVTVPGIKSVPALVTIKDSLPNFLANQLAALGRNPEEYRCYGGYGEPNRTFAKVPWVACCRRSVTKSVKDGYFIVLLFREDMAGCWLSLNQGYTQYQKAFVNDAAARKQAQVGATALAHIIDVPAGYVVGPIELAASTSLGKGYESGAIISRYYSGDSEPTPEQLSDDFAKLMEIYDRLLEKVGSNVVALLPDAEGPYQAAASELANKKSSKLQPIASGPRTPLRNQTSISKGRWRRDPNVAATALRNAHYQCEVDATHLSFIARKSKENFVEAHHLIPMAEQNRYTHSLDVPENVVSLCPTCHRLLHHGGYQARFAIASDLLSKRTAGLNTRGISISEAEIRTFYRHELDDD